VWWESDFVDQERNRVAEPGGRHTQEQSSHDESDLVMCCSLEDRGHNEEDVTDVDTELSTVFVGYPGSNWV
jgi:hypothetical protein